MGWTATPPRLTSVERVGRAFEITHFDWGSLLLCFGVCFCFCLDQVGEFALLFVLIKLFLFYLNKFVRCGVVNALIKGEIEMPGGARTL